MSRLTVVIADLESGAADVLRTAHAWALKGLLHDSLWIDRLGDPTEATLLGANGESRTITTLSELADRTDLEQMSIVSLHVIGDEAAAHSAPRSSVDYDGIHHTLYSRASAADVDVYSLAIVAVATGVPFPIQAYDPSWHATLVVAAEDRFADDQMAADVPAGELGPHAATAVASATGMWVTASRSPLDEVEGELKRSGRGSIRVLRASARFVDAGPLPDRIVDAVLTVHDAWPRPQGASPPVHIAADAQQLVAKALDEIVSLHELTFEALPAPLEPPLEELGIWEGLKLFFKTFSQILKGLPPQAVNTARNALDKKVVTFLQGVTYGPDSNVVLTLRGQTADGRVCPTTVEEKYEIVRAEKLPGTDVPIAEPDLWHDVRVVACAAVDGAEYPEEMTSPRFGREREVVLDPSAVAPSPYGSTATFPAPELGTGRAVRCADPRTADDLRRLLRQHIDSDESVSGKKSPSAARLAALDRWLADRRRSLAWRLGDAISDGVTGATSELADAISILSEGRPHLDDSKEDEILRRRLRRVVTSMLLLWVMAVAAVGYALATGRITALVAALVLFAATSVLLCIALGAFISIARQLARNEHRRRVSLVRWLHANDRAWDAAKKVTRFCSLYWQHLDWSEILGGVVHRPWGAKRQSPIGDPLGTARGTRSTLLSAAAPDRDKMLGAVSRGQNVTITIGWLGTLLERLEAMANLRYSRISATPSDQVDPALDVAGTGVVLRRDMESGEDILTPRGNLRHHVLTEHFADDLRRDQADQLLAAAFSVPPDDLLGPVELEGVGAGLSGETVSSFLRDVKASDRQVPFPLSMFSDRSVAVAPEQSIVMLPTQMGGSLDHAHTVTRAELGESLLYSAFRVDLSDVLEASRLASTGAGGGDDDDDGGITGTVKAPLL